MSKNLFSHIVRKNLRYNWKELRLVVFCETLVIAIAFAGVASYRMMSASYLGDSFLMEDGISRLFINAAVPFFISGIVLMIAVLAAYFGKRVPAYIMLQRIGIRKKDMTRMLVTELAISYCISLVCGLLLGNVAFVGIKLSVRNYLAGKVELQGISLWIYPIIIVITMLAYLLGFLLIGELESDFRMITSTQESARKEPLKSKRSGIWLMLGVGLCIYSGYGYFQLYQHESVYVLIAFLIGFYLIIKNVVRWILIKGKKKRGYLRHLLQRNQLYYRFRTTSRYLFVFSVLSAFALFYFSIQFVTVKNAQPTGELFPYDFMCIAEEADTDFWGQLQKDYQLDYVQYPMVRIANADKTERTEGRGQEHIQGQQIGISESTYHALKKRLNPSYQKKSLGLDAKGKSVYLVHQQDRSIKAQPVDWFYGKKKPNLHVGVPSLGYDWAQPMNTYKEKEVVGEEIGSLTGCFTQVKLENLVVLSDTYFAKAQTLWKTTDATTSVPIKYADAYYRKWYGEPTFIQGPTKLILFCAPKEVQKEIDARLEALEEGHQYVGNYDAQVQFHYWAEPAKKNLEIERALKIMINLFMMGTFLILVIIFFLVKSRMELREKQERDVFLQKMGMPKKQRIRLYRKEAGPFIWIPMATAAFVDVLFSLATFHVRMYEVEWILKCIKWEVGMSVWIVAIQGISICMIREIMIRRQGKHERDD